MSRNEEIVRFVDANLRLEGMLLSESEKQTIRDCLSGKKSFEKELKRTISYYKRLAA